MRGLGYAPFLYKEEDEMPPKPEFSKGIKIYSLIATIVVVLLLLLGYGEGDGSGIAALICIAYIVPFYYCCHFFTKWCEYSSAIKNPEKYQKQQKLQFSSVLPR